MNILKLYFKDKYQQYEDDTFYHYVQFVIVRNGDLSKDKEQADI